jgi:hypothetical protein
MKTLIIILSLIPLLTFGQFDGKGVFHSDTIVAKYVFNLTKSHAFYAFEDSAVVIDCTQNVWVQVTNTTGTLFTEIQTNEGFIISGDTIYYNKYTRPSVFPHILFHWGIDGYAGNNEDYEVRIYNIDNTEGIVRKAEGTTTGANNRIEIGTTSYDRHAAFGDRYIMEILNRTDNDDFTIENGWMTLVRKHLELAGYDPNTGKYIPQCEGDYEPLKNPK